ncbi:thioredoxin TrxC [Paraferrimonas sp. SM1919]|uniref:thioredoxin TrxC n=1 Tax=Paraferrimonas sp. SM1919 TaxID=2662263 RepID=UPI0013D50A8F|nr:thioredoxin TrxC [Paraferrimonas sp. SM1919]
MNIVCSHCLAINRVPQQRLSQQPNCGGCKQPLLAGTGLNVSSAQFQRFVEKSEFPIVVDFWASWCGPCKMFAPVFNQVADNKKSHAHFLKVNSETEQALAAQFQIRSIPTLLIIKDGKEVARQSGAFNAPQFEQWLKQHNVC